MRRALLGDTLDVALRGLVERGHVEHHALREAALVAARERGARAGDALGEALGSAIMRKEGKGDGKVEEG